MAWGFDCQLATLRLPKSSAGRSGTALAKSMLSKLRSASKQLTLLFDGLSTVSRNTITTKGTAIATHSKKVDRVKGSAMTVFFS
jgi:hypothetical protein